MKGIIVVELTLSLQIYEHLLLKSPINFSQTGLKIKWEFKGDLFTTIVIIVLLLH